MDTHVIELFPVPNFLTIPIKERPQRGPHRTAQFLLSGGENVRCSKVFHFLHWSYPKFTPDRPVCFGKVMHSIAMVYKSKTKTFLFCINIPTST